MCLRLPTKIIEIIHEVWDGNQKLCSFWVTDKEQQATQNHTLTSKMYNYYLKMMSLIKEYKKFAFVCTNKFMPN